MRARYDVVVIGSGFGGAITANRLARAGRSVAILERGRRWGKDEFPRTPGEVARNMWQDGKSVGLLDYRAFKKIDVIQGAGVGGGSLYYFNVNLQPPARIFDNPRWPEAIRHRTMQPYYDVVRHMLGSSPLTPPAGRAMPLRTRRFIDAARAAGHEPRPVDIAVYTGPERHNPHGGGLQQPCDYCGSCLLGCHVHAKNSLDLTYIAEAENRYDTEVFPLHAVEYIEPVARGYRVAFRQISQHNPAVGHRGSVVARNVIVAAGALGSTELLLRCRDHYRTLRDLGPALGQYFSGNGDFLIPATTRLPDPVDPGRGPSITAAVHHATDEHDITIEDLGLPNPLFWYLEGAAPTASSVTRKLGLAWRYVLRSLGFGGRRSRVSDEIDALLDGGRTTRMMPYLGMGTDAADGVMRLTDGRGDVRWSHRNSRRMFRDMERVLKQLSESAGGRYATSPLWRWPLRKLLTAHPLGGCVVGDSPDTSVVNHCGEVWQYPGLYVTDGATIPTALAVNPSLTIGAIAERAAFWMIHERDMDTEDARALITRPGCRPSELRAVNG